MNAPSSPRPQAATPRLLRVSPLNPASDTPNIADRFADLLAQLSPRRRRGLIARLARGYYEGWRPSRAEMEELITHLKHVESPGWAPAQASERPQPPGPAQ